jgi:hypothetical protein
MPIEPINPLSDGGEVRAEAPPSVSVRELEVCLIRTLKKRQHSRIIVVTRTSQREADSRGELYAFRERNNCIATFALQNLRDRPLANLAERAIVGLKVVLEAPSDVRMPIVEQPPMRFARICGTQPVANDRKTGKRIGVHRPFSVTAFLLLLVAHEAIDGLPEHQPFLSTEILRINGSEGA